MAKEAEEDRRHGQQKAMQAIINEKKAELDRYTVIIASFHNKNYNNILIY